MVWCACVSPAVAVAACLCFHEMTFRPTCSSVISRPLSRCNMGGGGEAPTQLCIPQTFEAYVRALRSHHARHTYSRSRAQARSQQRQQQPGRRGRHRAVPPLDGLPLVVVIAQAGAHRAQRGAAVRDGRRSVHAPLGRCVCAGMRRRCGQQAVRLDACRAPWQPAARRHLRRSRFAPCRRVALLRDARRRDRARARAGLARL